LANSGFLIKINASAKNIKMIKFGAQIKKYKKNEKNVEKNEGKKIPKDIKKMINLTKRGTT
jgi:hypothetical protein